MQENGEGAGAGAAGAAQVRFDGRRGELAGILFRNLLLNLVTLGIYRFWGRTRVRRFVWRHVALLDDAFEYLGTGRELFIGFLIALAVLLPVLGGYQLLRFLLAGDAPTLLLALQLLYYLLLFFLIQVAIYRMRRYRLTRTAWRGVRFGLDGSSLRYAALAVGYGLLTLATLGLAYPWMRKATIGYFARHARFGMAEVDLDPAPQAGWLFRRWLIVLLCLCPIFVALVVLVVNILVNATPGQAPENPGLVVGLFLGILLSIPIVSCVFLWYRVAEFRHFIDRLKIGDTSLRSSIRLRRVYGIFALYVLIIFGAVSSAMIVAITIGSLFFSMDFLSLQARGILGAAVPLVIVLLTLGIVKTLFFDIPLLRHVCETMGLANAEALEEVAQSSAGMPAYGEGAAEALDVGGF